VNLGLPVPDVESLSEDQLADRVQFLGLPDTLAARLDLRRTTANLLPVMAPFDGVVTRRNAVAGEVVDASRTLLVVADPGEMWLMLNVRLEDAGHLAPGQPVHFRSDGGDVAVTGQVAWISTEVDTRIRTVQVRVVLPNPDGRLRANVFGPGRIVLRREPNAVAVPAAAVQWDGDCYVVFVRDRNYDPHKSGSLLVFHVRKIRPGARDGRYVEALAGLLPGEVVAVGGSGVLQAELLKARLGES
jgi:cobalt-zinc-cadmium efflux system membrane fusion protein